MIKEKDIIYLESDEEIPSVISRLEETQAEKIILVVPQDAILIHSVINLKLLQKEAEKFHKQIVIVTSDAAGAKLAQKAGLVVFRSVAQAKEGIMPREITPAYSEEQIQKKDFAKSEETIQPTETLKVAKKPKPPSPRSKNIFFSFNFLKNKWVILGLVLAAVVLAGGLCYFYLSYAKVTVYLKTESKNKDLNLILAANPSGNEVKAELFEAEQEKSGQVATSGSKEIGNSAKGKITIYNYWDSAPQILVAQTRFQSLSSNKIFRTQSEITVPGTAIQQGQVVAGSIEIEVVAEEMGAEYNIAPDKFVIPGLPVAKQAKIYGESTEPMTGGYKKIVKVVSETDCNNLQNSLKEDLRKLLLKEINADLKSHKDLIKKDEFLIEEEKIATCDPAVDTESNLVVAKVRLRLILFAYREEDLKKSLKEAAQLSIDPAKDLADNSFSEISVKEKQADVNNKKLSLLLRTNLVLIPKLDLDVLKSNLYSRTREESIKYLDSFEEIEKSEVVFFPNFLKKIPSRRQQIKIEIKPLD